MNNFPSTVADTKTDEITASTPVPAIGDDDLAYEDDNEQGEGDVEGEEEEEEEEGDDESEDAELAKIEIRLPSAFLFNISP